MNDLLELPQTFVVGSRIYVSIVLAVATGILIFRRRRRPPDPGPGRGTKFLSDFILPDSSHPIADDRAERDRRPPRAATDSHGRVPCRGQGSRW